MSSEPAVVVENVSKVYPIFKEPADRLRQMIVPNLQRVIRQPPKKFYREFWALRDISFRVERGETVGIVGRNGSGKSTLLQVVSGTLTPSAGQASVNGRLSALLELGTGFNPDFTGRENVILNGQLKGILRREMEERFEEIAAFADIGDFVEQPVKTYSSGMLVRLAFAVHAMLDPDVLIVDEALAVGDVRFQIKCYDRLAELKKRGTSILFVSHDTGAVRRFCDKAIWINDGKVVEQGDAYQVTSGFTAFMLGGGPAVPTKTPDKRPDPTPPEGGDATTAKDDASTEVASAAKLATAVKIKPATPVVHQKPFAARFPYPPHGHQPISRWGSHAGLIKSVAITDGEEQVLLETPPNTRFQIHVVADLPVDLPAEGLSIGFGIRSVSGHDIIIRSTYDTAATHTLKQGGRVHVVFEVDNILAAGDYRLAVTVEDRSMVTPTYYDFIEGALLFKVPAGPYRWGVVTPNVPTRVTSEPS